MRTTGLLLMGVSGSGKTTLGRALAVCLGWGLYDADDFHSPANVAKMDSGMPLTDEDRAPWLAALHDRIAGEARAGRPFILACSALKARYRETLLAGISGVRIVYLRGSYQLFRARMAVRTDHYMKPGMLRSQFDALEEPPDAWVIEAALTVEQEVEQVCSMLTPLGPPISRREMGGGKGGKE